MAPSHFRHLAPLHRRRCSGEFPSYLFHCLLTLAVLLQLLVFPAFCSRREHTTRRQTFGPHGTETQDGFGRSGSGSSGSSGGSGRRNPGAGAGARMAAGASETAGTLLKKWAGQAADALLKGAEYDDAETEDAAGASETAARECGRQDQRTGARRKDPRGSTGKSEEGGHAEAQVKTEPGSCVRSHFR